MVPRLRFSVFPDTLIFTPNYDSRHNLGKRQIDEKQSAVGEVSIDWLNHETLSLD